MFQAPQCRSEDLNLVPNLCQELSLVSRSFSGRERTMLGLQEDHFFNGSP